MNKKVERDPELQKRLDELKENFNDLSGLLDRAMNGDLTDDDRQLFDERSKAKARPVAEVEADIRDTRQRLFDEFYDDDPLAIEMRVDEMPEMTKLKNELYWSKVKEAERRKG